MTKTFQITGGIFVLVSLILFRTQNKTPSIIFLCIAVLIFLCSLIAHSGETKKEQLEEQKKQEQQRYDSIIEHYEKHHNLKPIIDTFLDLTNDQKAYLYDKAYEDIKRRKPQKGKNPYRT